MTTEQTAMLTGAVNAIYGPRARLPIEAVSQVSRELVGLLNAYVSQHECGLRDSVFRFGYYAPEVRVVRFTDEARTRAEAEVSTGGSGGGLFLEKESGVWRVTGVMDAWWIC